MVIIKCIGYRIMTPLASLLLCNFVCHPVRNLPEKLQTGTVSVCLLRVHYRLNNSIVLLLVATMMIKETDLVLFATTALLENAIGRSIYTFIKQNSRLINSVRSRCSPNVSCLKERLLMFVYLGKLFRSQFGNV